MGSPMVFHTAPPQPASNARMTCSPQLVGGAEASQNGFGQRMPPAKVVERSGVGVSGMDSLERLRDRNTGTFSISDGIHHFAASVHAVATRIILGALASLQQGEWRLSDGGDHHVAW